MKIPVVLSVVHVAIDADGLLAVDVDGVPLDSEQTRTRDHLPAVIDEITSDLGAPVRVEVREADGSTFTDVATPPIRHQPPRSSHPPRHPRRWPVPGSSRARRSPWRTSSFARTPMPKATLRSTSRPHCSLPRAAVSCFSG